MFKRKSAKKEKPAKSKKAKAKPKKEKKPKAARARSEIVVQKPDTDIYTVMLIIAFVSVLIACLLLYFELSRYGSYPWWNAS